MIESNGDEKKNRANEMCAVYHKIETATLGDVNANGFNLISGEQSNVKLSQYWLHSNNVYSIRAMALPAYRISRTKKKRNPTQNPKTDCTSFYRPQGNNTIKSPFICILSRNGNFS